MSVYGDPIDTDPHKALLDEVARTVGHVEWMRALISEFGDKHEKKDEEAANALVQWTPALGMAPSAWLGIYQEERKHLVRVAKACIDAGVSEKQVQIVQEQARQLAMILKAFIMSHDLAMTPQQRIVAPKVVRALMEKSDAELAAIDTASTILDTTKVASVVEEVPED